MATHFLLLLRQSCAPSTAQFESFTLRRQGGRDSPREPAGHEVQGDAPLHVRHLRLPRRPLQAAGADYYSVK